MTTTYIPSNEEIQELKTEIAKLQFQQNQLSAQLETNNDAYREISKKLTECYNKLNELKDIETIFNEFETKSTEIKKKVRKTSLKFGIPGVILSWFVGGTIANAFFGAIIGVALATATVVGSAIAYYNHKLKKDKEIIKNNNIRRVKRKIAEEETKIDNYLAQQRQIDKDNKVVSRVYSENQTKLEDLRLKLSILEPTSTQPTKTKPYTKFNMPQS